MSEIIQTEEASTPSTPSAAKWKHYFKAAGMFFKGSDGVEKQVATTEYVDMAVTQTTATSHTTDYTVLPADVGKILVFTGNNLNITLPESASITAGWKITIVNANAFVSQSDSATLHTSFSSSTPVGQKNLRIIRSNSDTVNHISTELLGASLIIPPMDCVDIVLAESNHFMAMPSSTVGWKDLPTTPVTLGSNANDPAESLIDASFMRGWEFTNANAGAEKEVYYSIHINHDYVMGTKIYPHVHWNSGNTTATTIVGWCWVYAAVKGHGQQAMSPSGTLIKASTAMNGTPYTHYVTETDDANAIPATNLEPDTNIYFKMFRDSANTNTTGDNTTTSAWVSFTDCHYLSTDGGTPLKAPPFFL